VRLSRLTLIVRRESLTYDGGDRRTGTPHELTTAAPENSRDHAEPRRFARFPGPPACPRRPTRGAPAQSAPPSAVAFGAARPGLADVAFRLLVVVTTPDPLGHRGCLRGGPHCQRRPADRPRAPRPLPPPAERPGRAGPGARGDRPGPLPRPGQHCPRQGGHRAR